MRRAAIVLLTIAALFFSAREISSVQAQPAKVDLRIVLAVDCSFSVNGLEFRLQRDGMAAALTHPLVLEAIAQGREGRIAVSVVQWSTFENQALVMPWTIIDSEASGQFAAAQLARTEREAPIGTTSYSGAIRIGLALLSQSADMGGRAVIDLAADGTHNNGPSVEQWRDIAVTQGVTINGLAILNEVHWLHYYMQNHLIGGLGAFVETAKDYKDFTRAFRRKLLREIRGNVYS